MESGFPEYNSSLSACEGPSLLPFNGAGFEPEPCERTADVQVDCWQQLEAFWGAEKHRCQHELPPHGSSSTENQLQCRDYLSEPPRAALSPQRLARVSIQTREDRPVRRNVRLGHGRVRPFVFTVYPQRSASRSGHLPDHSVCHLLICSENTSLAYELVLVYVK